MYFKTHTCLAAYMNILRRNPNATCIASQTVAYGVTAVGPINQRGAAEEKQVFLSGKLG